MIGIAEIRGAAARLEGVAHRTPVLCSRTLDERVGAHVFLKCENFQRMGAFKFRGAYNRLAQLTAAQREGGVVAFSSGNHAQGVALAAQLLGIRATIVMPHDAPASKLAATRGYGAEVIEYERGRTPREEIAQRLSEERGATLVPPFDDERIIAGAGTAALELLEEIGELDAIVVPTGGGGLLSGTAVAAHSGGERTAIYGVEPEAGDDFAQSLERGAIVSIPVPTTIADGLRTQAPSALTLGIARAHGVRVVTVSDDDLRQAMQLLFERMKIVVEPSGAAGVAALLSRKLALQGQRVGVIISGGNVDALQFSYLISPQAT